FGFLIRFFFLVLEDTDDSLAPIVGAMKEKFLKYWKTVPLLTIVANCLHPAYKKIYTIKMLRRYYNNLDITNTSVEQTVSQAIEGLFNAYNAQLNVQQPASTSQTPQYIFLFPIYLINFGLF
ncbi:RNase-H fold domain-containing protein, partial [Algimonas porphyrae]|uniref:RNase-H fold domain-containing protein n=1 Tax=Algimonas porphyrae TaxID=1128113 RepID=UPI0024E06AA7